MKAKGKPSRDGSTLLPSSLEESFVLDGPGEYEVRVAAKGFQTEVLTVPVQVGITTAGNVKLAVGKATESARQSPR